MYQEISWYVPKNSVTKLFAHTKYLVHWYTGTPVILVVRKMLVPGAAGLAARPRNVLGLVQKRSSLPHTPLVWYVVFDETQAHTFRRCNRGGLHYHCLLIMSLVFPETLARVRHRTPGGRA